MTKETINYKITTQDADGNPLLTAPMGYFSSYNEAVHTFKALIARHPEYEITLHSIYYKGDICIGMTEEAKYKNGKEWWEAEEEAKALTEYADTDRGWDDIPETDEISWMPMG